MSFGFWEKRKKKEDVLGFEFWVIGLGFLVFYTCFACCVCFFPEIFRESIYSILICLGFDG